MKRYTLHRAGRLLFLLTAVMALTSVNAFAGGAGALPWDGSLATIGVSITGPVAYWISAIFILLAFGGVIISGHLTDFGRTAVLAVSGGAGILGVIAFMAPVFGVAGAIV